MQYREMVKRVFEALDRPSRILTVPFWFSDGGMGPDGCEYQHWTTAVAERMNQDLRFDGSDATRDPQFFGIQTGNRRFTWSKLMISNYNTKFSRLHIPVNHILCYIRC